MNLQPHKSALLISAPVGMAASTLRACFGQPAEACTSCTFNTVTNTFLIIKPVFLDCSSSTLKF
jgi:hypothetical protein